MLNLYNYDLIIAGKATASLIPAKVGDVVKSGSLQRLTKRGEYVTYIAHLEACKFVDIHGHKEKAHRLIAGFFEPVSLASISDYLLTTVDFTRQGFSTFEDMVNVYSRYYVERPLAWSFRVTLCQPTTD